MNSGPNQAKAALVLAALIMSGCVFQRGFPAIAGIGNFDSVDEKIYRGAQPPAEGLRFLAHKGIKTVINLRLPSDSAPYEPAVCAQLGLKYLSLPLEGVGAPKDREMRAILDKIETAEGPVFIHCQYGCDRTGMVIACWRIQHNGWTPAQALQEADVYGLSQMEYRMRVFIERFHRQ